MKKTLYLFFFITPIIQVLSSPKLQARSHLDACVSNSALAKCDGSLCDFFDCTTHMLNPDTIESSDEQIIRKNIDEMMQEFEIESFDKWYTLMDKEVVDVTGNQVKYGLEATKKYWDARLPDHEISIVEWSLAYFEVIGDLAISHIVYTASFYVDGELETIPWHIVWKKIEGEWRIYRDF